VKIKAQHGLVTTITTAGGAQYSAILAAVYLSAALLLRRRAIRLARAAVPDAGARGKWLSDQGLASQVSAQVAKLVATLEPLLASGSTGAFVKLLN
jgi:hypothetical protein